MPTLSIRKLYSQGSVLNDTHLDAIRTDVQDLINTTKLNSDNFQTGGIATANIADSAVTTAKLADGAVTAAKITAATITSTELAASVSGGLAPAGSIVAYGGTSAPTGWLLCNGAAVSRSTYSTLYTAIGVTFGYGDNATTFNVPDIRGRFIRGFDNGQGRDPDAASRTAINTGGTTGDNVGSLQGDAYAAHTHSELGATQAGTNISSGTNYSATLAASTTGSSGSSTETRPKNVSCWYIIKT